VRSDTRKRAYLTFIGAIIISKTTTMQHQLPHATFLALDRFVMGKAASGLAHAGHAVNLFNVN
jgi:hypothetical protein